ncbi:hypothetical protein ACWC5I_39550, partial [Kitasatospora sp. NPDC001574]
MPGAENADEQGAHHADDLPGEPDTVMSKVSLVVGMVSHVCVRKSPGGGLTGRSEGATAVRGQAGAGNGADGSARRGHGQQPAARQDGDPRP